MRSRFAQWDDIETGLLSFQIIGKRESDNQIVIAIHSLPGQNTSLDPDTIADNWIDDNQAEAQALVNASDRIGRRPSAETKQNDVKQWMRTHPQKTFIRNLFKANPPDVESAIDGLLASAIGGDAGDIARIELMLAVLVSFMQSSAELQDFFEVAEDE